MKEKIFGIVLAIAVVMLPMSVQAEDFNATIFGSADENMTSTTLTSPSLTCPKDATGEYATCYIGISVLSGSVPSFSVNATLTNMTYDSFEVLNGWTMTSPVQNGSNITFNFTTKTPATVGQKVLVAKITYKVVNKAEVCGIRISAGAVDTPSTTTYPSCGTQGGKYYCKNSQECTKTQYDSECLPDNPKTGSVIPYVVVLGGLGVAGALFFVTRKKAKMYHV